MRNYAFSAAIIAATAFATPTFALEAMRCNVQTKPGLFQPVLRIVMQGKMEDIRMGDEGLTRAIFYRDKEVLKYVSTRMKMPATQMPASVSGVCGSVDAQQTAFQGGNGTGGAVVTAEPSTPDIPSLPDLPDFPDTTPLSESDLEGTFEYE